VKAVRRPLLQSDEVTADVEYVKLSTYRGAPKAGQSAEQRFETLARAWRRRTLRPVLFVAATLVIALTIAGTLAQGQAKFWLGLMVGATMALYVALRDSPPAYIENWRKGSDGERRTARALRPLEREGWGIWHDRNRGNGTNIDHIAVGDAGVFLLDSKNYSGEARIEGDQLKVRLPEDDNDGWVCRGIGGRMRGASAEVSELIEAATGVRVWIQPVVVLWTRFPQQVFQEGGVFFIQGNELALWLRERRLSARGLDKERVNSFLHGWGLGPGPAPKRFATGPVAS
jgi:hypothetical protein